MKTIFKVAKRFKYEGKFYRYRQLVEFDYDDVRLLRRRGQLIPMKDQKLARKLLNKPQETQDEPEVKTLNLPKKTRGKNAKK